ncbi:DMT family transporter [Methanolobus sp. ZRKC3]|uniref:EamA family transporter n=1 Tax=Methanolobus sp. ZRKC3 TaxID=3125786 RepID=UPI003247C72D
MELSVVIFGLISAAFWGAGDFSGGVATKKHEVLSVATIAQIIGLLILSLVALTLGENTPSIENIMWGAAAGISGGIGILALYHALSIEKMGVVAPVTAVSSALVPVVFGMMSEGIPASIQILGFFFALIGVWLISREDSDSAIHLSRLKLPLIAGFGFGFFMILIDQLNGTGILWPLVGARVASISMFLLAGVYKGGMQMPEMKHLPLIILAGICDSGGNVFYTLAAQAGRIDIAAVLSSLYPAATVLLAWIFLRERLTYRQWIGIISAMLAVVLIS